MHRSRSFALLRHALVIAAAVSACLLPSPAVAAEAPASVAPPQLAYVLTTGGIRANLVDRLHLNGRQEAKLRELGWKLYWEQRRIQRRSDLVTMNGALSLAEKRRIIAETGFNEQLHDAEDVTAAQVASAVGIPVDTLTAAVDEVWRQDAAEHRLQTELDALGVTPQAITGAFRVYGTRFEYQEGVAVPDKYVKFASLDWDVSRPSGYPDGTYGVSLYWDGIKHGRDGSGTERVAPAKTLPFVKVTDVGPWNTDDNWWNTYTSDGKPTSAEPRPRRINSRGISYRSTSIGGGGPDYLVNEKHLPRGLPEAQAAYFGMYGYTTPSPRPAPYVVRDAAGKIKDTNYWSSPSGGTWRGADQFGRQVMNPAGIDLGHVPYAQLGLTDNEWVEVIPLWEARLALNSAFHVTPGPYLTGQVLTFSFNLKNLGSLTGTWEKVQLRIKVDDVTVASPEQGAFSLAPGLSRSFTFNKELDRAGTWEVTPMVRRAGIWSEVDGASATLQVAKRSFGRIAGVDRYETAVKVSQRAFPGGAPAVVVATGENFPDALAGAALARAEKGPLLLAPFNSLPPSVRAEISRLQPSKVIILGSTKVVSWPVQKEIGALVGGTSKTTRIYGWNRYATARLVAEAVAAKTGGKAADGTVIVATGRDFPDALAGSVLSAVEAWPVLLTEPSYLPTDTAAAVSKLGVTRTIVLGSEGVVGKGPASKLPGLVRLGGVDRYDTAAKVADWAERNSSLRFTYVGLATGLAFPDALAGGTLAASRGGMLLLTSPSALSQPSRLRLVSHRTVTAQLDVYGSTKVVSDAVWWQARTALH